MKKSDCFLLTNLVIDRMPYFFLGGNQTFWRIWLLISLVPCFCQSSWKSTGSLLEGLLQIVVTDRHTFWIPRGFHYLTHPQTYNSSYLVLAYVCIIINASWHITTWQEGAVTGGHRNTWPMGACERLTVSTELASSSHQTKLNSQQWRFCI